MDAAIVQHVYEAHIAAVIKVNNEIKVAVPGLESFEKPGTLVTERKTIRDWSNETECFVWTSLHCADFSCFHSFDFQNMHPRQFEWNKSEKIASLNSQIFKNPYRASLSVVRHFKSMLTSSQFFPVFVGTLQTPQGEKGDPPLEMTLSEFDSFWSSNIVQKEYDAPLSSSNKNEQRPTAKVTKVDDTNTVSPCTGSFKRTSCAHVHVLCMFIISNLTWRCTLIVAYSAVESCTCKTYPRSYSVIVTLLRLRRVVIPLLRVFLDYANPGVCVVVDSWLAPGWRRRGQL